MSNYQFCLHNKVYPDSPTYNLPFVFKIEGELNTSAFRESVGTVLSRHEIFRMTFSGKNFDPEAHEQPLYFFKQIDLEGSAELYEQLALRIDEEISRPFDIGTGPLIRLHLFRLEPSQFVLLVLMHHSITDLRSKELLLRQISESYEAILKKEQLTVPEARFKYSDYLNRLREWLSSPAADKVREFWKNELRDFEGLIQLPLDHPRPSVASSSGNAFFFQLSPEQAECFKHACRRLSIAPFVALLACYLILLARYSRQKQIVIGVPLTNRRNSEDKNTMGCYVNILPLAFKLRDDTTIMQAMEMVRCKMLQAHRHQEIPFHEIVTAVRPQREPSYNPIFQVGFTYEPLMELPLKGLSVVSEKWHNHGTQMDLFLNIFEMSTGIRGYFEYDRALFDQETIARISNHYENLITSWHHHAEQQIQKMDILSPDERAKLLYQWNDTAVDYGADECIHRIFERQAARTPASPSLVFNTAVLTYQEFNERANQFAHYIIAQGAGPENIIGVFMERSLEMVIALYGIMKAGAAYLPLESDLPEQRLSFILKESGTNLLLTHEQLKDKLPSFSGTVFSLDAQWPVIAEYSRENPVSKVTPDNLAYVIYTSGSTGKPKGVMVEHRGLFNRLKWMQETYGLTPEDRVLQKTPFGFDVSVWEFFWPLLTGATLVIAPPAAHRDPIKLCRVIRQNGITTLHFVPSMLRIFLEADEASDCKSLRRVFCSGEALSWSLRSAFFERLSCDLHNLYGPTEATVDVSFWDCGQQKYPGRVPIGYPVANTMLYILDDYLQPVPEGVTGHLYIGGVQVACGYLGREDLTRDRFILNPFDSSGKGRLYKTGDLARHLPDGAIEYLGRADFQVKIFGNRIELTEIEAALRSHPMIDDAVVTLFGADKEGQLIAYLVTDVTDIKVLLPKKHLLEILPYYMVPNSYVLLKEFPLTGSGKIDRKLLPSIKLLEEAPKAPPRNQQMDLDYVKLITTIWGKILNTGEVDIDCNFFDAGGSSLQVAELAVRLEEELGFRMPVVKVFQYPTITALSGYIEQKANA